MMVPVYDILNCGPRRRFSANGKLVHNSMSLNAQNLPRLGKKPSPADTLRRSLRAPKGHKVVVADLSGIELRMNHFLWQVPSSMELFHKDPAEADLYRAFASRLYYVPEAEVTSDQRMLGKIGQLQLQYGSGAAKFQDVARLWGAPMRLEEAVNIVRTWREMYVEIVRGWRRCSDALHSMARGDEGIALDPWGLCTTVKDGIKTPRGHIWYPGLHRANDQWQYQNRKTSVKIYGAKIVENCLAADTLVLTDRGWKRIQSVLSTDRVYDGVEFVDHGGTIFKSVQPCVTVDGVLMTADHEVLTDEGWKAASQVQRLDGPALRYADRDPSFAQHWEKMEMGVPVRLREYVRQARQRRRERSEARRNAQLRVRNWGADWEQKQASRYVEASSVRRVAQHDRSLQAAFAPSVGELRRAWNKSLRFVAGVVRELLGRYGRELQTWAYAGSSEQHWRLHPEQLPVENFERAEQKPARFNPRSGYTRAVETDRHITVYPVLPTQPGQAADRCSRQAQSYEVYDIVNAGPRHRFVVLGGRGPFIVHNCIQSLARDAMADMILKVSARYPMAHTVHDEIVLVVPEDDAEEALAYMQKVMRAGIEWFPELVTWSMGGIGDNYGDAKS